MRQLAVGDAPMVLRVDRQACNKYRLNLLLRAHTIKARLATALSILSACKSSFSHLKSGFKDDSRFVSNLRIHVRTCGHLPRVVIIFTETSEQ
jgi:hypothetical protein